MAGSVQILLFRSNFKKISAIVSAGTCKASTDEALARTVEALASSDEALASTVEALASTFEALASPVGALASTDEVQY